MNGREFIKQAKELAKRNGVSCRFDAEHGKGSHGTLYYGSSKTTVKDRRKDIGKRLFKEMCKQIGIDPKDL